MGQGAFPGDVMVGSSLGHQGGAQASFPGMEVKGPREVMAGGTVCKILVPCTQELDTLTLPCGC